MGRLVIVVGSPLFEHDHRLRLWAHDFLHTAFSEGEGPETIILGRNASPVELWAWEMAHHCGLHRIIIGLDGVCWSSREDAWKWPEGQEPATLESATGVVMTMAAMRAAGGWSVEVWSFELPGVEMIDPLLPIARRLRLPVCVYRPGDPPRLPMHTFALT